MSLVECRYNKNHRMKASKREIHEQKCPDRFKCKTKYKHCPYDPLELIEEKDYEKHILTCKSRPKITVEEEENIERAKALNDIATEQELIKHARETYYKGCVEEPEIPGLERKKQKKNKKKKKFVNDISNKIGNHEQKHIEAMNEVLNNDNGDDDNEHEMKDFIGDLEFDPPEIGEENEENDIKNFEKKMKEESKKEDKQQNKNDNKEFETKSSKSYFYKYDPNDEDKDIERFSANIIVPDTINKILGFA